MRETIARLCEQYHLTHAVVATMPPGASAYACWATSTFYTLPIENEKQCARAVHEIAHLIAGACSGREPHRPVRIGDAIRCVACENDAADIALQIVPLTRTMFAEIQRGLWHYRQTTPAAAAELARLDRLASLETWAAAQQLWRDSPLFDN